MSEETLATELLHQIKLNAQRWFVAFCVMVAVEVATIIGFVWYISLPVEEGNIEYSQTAEDITDSKVTQTIGEIDDGKSNPNSK